MLLILKVCFDPNKPGACPPPCSAVLICIVSDLQLSADEEHKIVTIGEGCEPIQALLSKCTLCMPTLLLKIA